MPVTKITPSLNCIHTFQVQAPQDQYLNAINAIAISPDQTKIAVVGDKFRQRQNQWTFTVWDLATQTATDLAQANAYAAHKANINTLAFSQDSQFIVLGSQDHAYNVELKKPESPSLSIWTVQPGAKPQIQTVDSGCILAIVCHPTDAELATVSNGGKIQLWHDQFATGQLHKIKDWQAQPSHVLSFSHDGRHLWTGDTKGEIQQWDAIGGELIRTFPKQDYLIRAIALSPDEQTLVSSSNQRIKIWDIKTGEVRRSFFGHPDWVRGLAITPDSQFLISTGDYKIKIWALDSGEKLATIPAHPAAVRGMAMSQDGTLLTTASRDGTVKVWTIES